jgi:diguanylate cyclase (GGDEF)-like protein/PAS domain S-box-containing protein
MMKLWAGAVAGLRRVQALRRLFLSYQGTVQEGPLRREQASILYSVVLLYVVLGITSCMLFTLDFRRQASPALAAVFCLTLALYGAMTAAAVQWKQRLDAPVFIRTATWILFGIGSSWGILVNLFAHAARGDQRATLVGLIMALVSTPMLTVPLSAGLAYFVPVSMLCSVAVLYTLQPLQNGAVLSFFGFLGFAVIALVHLNKTVLERSIGRLDLQRQHEIVRVFLREYEEVSADWLWETDEAGLLRNVSARMAASLHITADALERRPLLGLLAVSDAEPDSRADLMQCMQKRTAFRDLSLALECEGKKRWFSLTGHPVHDGAGLFCGFRGIGSDITEVRAARQRIEFLANHDGMTGLLNRKAFVDELAQRCQTVNGAPFALLLIDVDDFKGINDGLGHPAGDILLCAIANRLGHAVRAGDLTARLGGDEFAVLMHHEAPSGAAAVAERISQAIRAEVLIDGFPVSPSATIGVALFPDHGGSLEVLMRRADLALYQAKERCKGTSCVFEIGMELEAVGRMRLQSELATALNRGEIYLDYQPIFNIRSNTVVSVEALARWSHPTRGVLSAESFIPSAEASTDLIDRLGTYVLKMACHAAAGWPSRIPVAVNLSPRQFRSGRFAATLRDCLIDSGLPPARLTIEVTETVLLATTETTMAQLDAIRAMGVRLVLDDFGTGYSSLTYLRGFNVDGIKIDASFIRDLPGSQKAVAIVRTVGRLASDMNIYVVAEGVETLEQLAWLRGNGIDFAQGYLLGRPAAMPVVSSDAWSL